MTFAVLYAVFSALNLVCALAVTAVLPAEVPMLFNAALEVKSYGSPWTFAAFPVLSALLAFGVFAVTLKGGARRMIYAAIFGALGALVSCAGWLCTGFAVQTLSFGERAVFPYAAVTVLPFSLGTAALGAYLAALPSGVPFGERAQSPLREKSCRAAGKALFVTGSLSAVLAVLFTCLNAPRLDYLAVVGCFVLIGGAVLFSFLYAARLARKEN